MYTHKGKYLKPLIKLIGAKQKSRDRLYPLFPKHEVYYEPFMGSGSILIGKEKSLEEYVNDINKDIVDFYKVIQTSHHKFHMQFADYFSLLEIKELEKGKQAFYDFRDSPPEDKVGKAVWTYIINKACMNGILRKNKDGKCNSSYCGTLKGRGWFTKDWLEAVHERIKNVKFMSWDFRNFLWGIEDSEDSFIFLDPPYKLKSKDHPDGTVTVYNGEKFTDRDHEDLANFLISYKKSKWMMTINDCQWIRDTYKDYNLIENPIFYSCSNSGTKGRGIRKELIIKNY